MSDTLPKYFDYLDEYGGELQRRIGTCVEINKIKFWRTYGLSDIDGVTGGCRKLIEHALNALANSDEEVVSLKLQDKINECRDRGLIDDRMMKKLHEIRKNGNDAVHSSINAYDARASMELVDDFLRYLLRIWNIDPTVAPEATRDPGSIFLLCSEEDVSRLNHKAKTATIISGDPEIEKKTRRIAESALTTSKTQENLLNEMSEMLQRATEIRTKLESVPSTKTGNNDLNKMQETLLSDCDDILQEVIQKSNRVRISLDDAEKQVDDILNEQDYIKKLLAATGIQGRATDLQFEVMAFPRTQGALTNTLMLSGGAGTGKTLCLLAKLISDVSGDKQLDLGGVEKKSALFLCFNSSLAGYVKELLNAYADNDINIEVANYDQFVNQLIRKRPIREFSHLESFAQEVRYGGPPYWNVAYGGVANSFIAQAMKEVAKDHPDFSKAYYLDWSSQQNIDWVGEEIRWLDSRYLNPEYALREYPTTSRVGRGTKHLPNERVRRIILEIWRRYEAILVENRHYTVEQTTKKLLEASSLPKYDSIAIDEVQDFTLASVKLVLRLRQSEKSCIYISGDENQKIYQRDFTWKELGESVRGHTITLKKNMRNKEAIRRFAERLNGKASTYDASSNSVYISNKTDEELLELIGSILSKTGEHQKTVIIGNKAKWQAMLRERRIPYKDASGGYISKPGLYIINDLISKGLEFDNVIVDYDHPVAEDEAGEQRLRYVHFTRARRRLYIRYTDTPPKLLSDYYPDFLHKE